MDKVLLHGVIRGVVKISGEAHAIPYRGIACVVSEYKTQGEENPGPRLLLYQSVIEKVMESHALIPVKFETVLDSPEEVKMALEAGYREFSKRLEAFKGRVEVNVTAKWREINAHIKQIAEKEPEISDLKKAIAGKPFEETLDQRIRLGYLIKGALDRERERLEKEMVKTLKKEAVDARCHEPGQDAVVLNAAFLVEKEREGRFYETVNALSEDYATDMAFRYVSPLPPYNFSTIEIEKIKFEEVERARELLGLGETFGPDEIKEAYRRKTLEIHPDSGTDSRGEKFEAVKNASDLLKKVLKDGGPFRGGENFFVVGVVEG